MSQKYEKLKSNGPWWSLLREAVAEYALETGAAELPVGHFIEWLADWGREVRRRQTGLMLLTAHRAKGLEFNHVAVLDGGWDRVGQNEDHDAPLRLYYVAMTRARKTLTLARFNGANALADTLPDSASVVRRAASLLPAAPPELARHYARLSLRDIDLGFAGRRTVGRGKAMRVVMKMSSALGVAPHPNACAATGGIRLTPARLSFLRRFPYRNRDQRRQPKQQQADCDKPGL